MRGVLCGAMRMHVFYVLRITINQRVCLRVYMHTINSVWVHNRHVAARGEKKTHPPPPSKKGKGKGEKRTQKGR